MSTLTPRSVDASAIQEHFYKIFPQDLNASNTMFGGQVMSILDRIALVVAERHSGQTCVTVAVDALHFIEPARQGDILLFQASINRSWGTSMEIGVRIFAEDYKLSTRRHIVSAYFTFVSVDENRKPIPVPPVIPETRDQKRRYEEAGLRRTRRQQEAKDQIIRKRAYIEQEK